MDEAHVEHAVGFVQHQNFNAVQAQSILLHKIEQAARRGDQDIETIHQVAHLAAHRHASDGERGLQAQMTPIGTEAVEDLSG
jgi:hypothetical protein